MPGDVNPVSKDARAEHEAVQQLVQESELQAVRLTRLAAEVADDIPDEVNANFTVGEVAVQGGGDENGFLRVRISHAVQFFSAEGPVADIGFTHTAQFRFDGSERPDNTTIRNWVMGNVYFMVYPYVRETLQSVCARFDLPVMVLGYLRRGDIAPQSITVVINTTRLAADLASPTRDTEAAPE